MSKHASDTVEYWEDVERFLVSLAPRVEAGDVEGDPAQAARELDGALRVVRRAIEKRRRIAL